MDQLQRERQLIQETKKLLQRFEDQDIDNLIKPDFWSCGIFTNIRYQRQGPQRLRVEYMHNYSKYTALLSIDSILSQLTQKVR